MSITRIPYSQRQQQDVLEVAKKYDNIIGIDPDVDASGVASLWVRCRHVECSAMPFPKLLGYLQSAKHLSEESGDSLVVVVEAGWLNASNWHANEKHNHRAAARIGSKVGANHETGKKIVEMCKEFGIDVELKRPLVKCWTGPDRKITHRELCDIMPITGETTQEMRDAALIAWDYAGLPIIIPPKK